jgi:uncharacterized membrane protein YdjX (TVP38/TMEM64 family)
MNLKKITFYLWLILITGGMITYLFFPDKLSFSFMETTVGSHPIATLILYYIILSFQGVVFMPSPLIFLGALIFNPIELFIVNMAGVMTSATIVYYFSKYLEFDKYFETRYNKYTHIIRSKFMNKEFPVIVGWSFLPMVPTNLIVYVGSTLEISAFKCLLGVFIGESLINSFYIISITVLFKGNLS